MIRNLKIISQTFQNLTILELGGIKPIDIIDK